MAPINGLDGLRAHGRLLWDARQRGWVGNPHDIVSVLATDGFREYKQELASRGRDRRAMGGLWEGLRDVDGSVASAIWVGHPEQTDAIVFIALNGELVTDEPHRTWHNDAGENDSRTD
jgi:hypothetical protein